MTLAATKYPKVIAPTGAMNIPVKHWVPNDIDEKTRGQVENLAALPFAISHIALMPDAHAGYGMPIGGVLFADKVVVPYAIGVDIGCGVQIARTNLIWEDNFDREKLKNVLRQIQRDIPTGFSTHKVAPIDILDVADDITRRMPDPNAFDRIKVLPDLNLGWLLDSANVQLGTLGGGNHFLEVQRDEDNRVYFMLHSGSRGLGKKICDFFVKEAQRLNALWYSDVPDKELAYLPIEDPLGKAYMDAMNVALRWAEINRVEMMSKAEYAFRKHASVHDFDVLTDVHHNYANWENHKGKNGIVHRKGAVSAKLGEMVLIPGSMGTNSYIAEGLGNTDSFMTCQHGAGRAFGRKEMSRRMTTEEVMEDMKTRGIEFISNEPKSAMEEAAQAYKSIDDVMDASVDLIKPLVKLTPLGVVKG